MKQIENIREMVNQLGHDNKDRAINMELSSLAVDVKELRDCIQSLYVIMSLTAKNFDIDRINRILKRTE